MSSYTQDFLIFSLICFLGEKGFSLCEQVLGRLWRVLSGSEGFQLF